MTFFTSVLHLNGIRRIIMRLYLFILTTCIAFLHVSANVKAQKITLSVRDASLEQVFSQIEKQTGYGFWYDPGILNGLNKVTVDFKDTDLRPALKQCFENQPLTYQIVDKTIVIQVKEATLERIPKQERILIIGQIKDHDGKPLRGVTIKVKGLNLGTVTNENGQFRIYVQDEKAVLIFSSVGFISIQVPVLNKRELDITMVPETLSIKEVEISTGYEQVKPDRFIGSAAVVDSLILERQVGRDLLTRLDGTTNGLLFNKSVAGSGLQVQLRGVSTLNVNTDLNGLSSQNPLIILDDFPYTGDINSINPNDISSISILKDAVAVSIWGARAGNGVIVIKSKSGKLNQPLSVRFTSNISISEKPNLNYFPVMSSSDFIDVEQYLFGRGYYDLQLQFPQFFATSPVVDILEKQRIGEINDVEAKKQIDALRILDVKNDSEKYIYRNAVNTQNYLSASGGSNQLSYNFSIGADNNTSSIQGPGRNNRYTTTTNIRFKPFRQAEFTMGINYINENSKLDGLRYPVPSGGKSAVYPYARLADEQGNHLPIPYSYRHTFLKTLPYDKMLNWEFRPLDELYLVDRQVKQNLIRLNFGTVIHFTSWLAGEIKYQYSHQNTNNPNFYSLDTYYTRDLINQFTNPTTYERAVPLGGILDQMTNELTSHNVRGQLNIRKNWRGIHEFTALIAGETGKTIKNGSSNRLYGYDNEILRFSDQVDYKGVYPYFVSGSGRISSGISIDLRRNNLVSTLANASYLYDSKYGVYLSARRDGANLFGVAINNKWKPLWSIGGRWNISNENFYHVDWMTNLALRATYGFAGNINNSISALTTIHYSGSPNQLGQNYASLGGIPNPDLRWEEVRTFNLALDFGILNGRISGNLEWYRKKAKDIIAEFPIDPTLGLGNATYPMNAANLNTKGIDFGLQSQNIVGKFRWTTNLNLNTAKTVVSKYFQETITTPNSPIIREGDLYQALYAYRWAGLDPETGDPRGYIGKLISKDYDAIFYDSLRNQAYIGSAIPLFFGNILNNVSFKGFSLSANISFRFNYYFNRPSIDYFRLFGNWRSHKDYETRWQHPGDEAKTNVPSLPYPADQNRDKFYQFSEINYEKGDHIRLQDIHLSYEIPVKALGRRSIKGLQVFCYVNNLNIMLYKASDAGYDPDYPTSLFPPVKSYSFGLNLNL